MTDKYEYVSNCCGTQMEMERGHCPSCGEGCEVVKICNNCGDDFTNKGDQCNNCDPEWLQDK